MPTTEITSSITDQLRALIRLQHIDSKIDQVEKLRGDLPEEIRDLEDEKAGLQTRIENAKEEEKQAEVQRRKLQMDITESEGLIKKYEEQQLNVRNNREYDALTKEIEAQRQRINQAEADIESFTERDAANEPEFSNGRQHTGGGQGSSTRTRNTQPRWSARGIGSCVRRWGWVRRRWRTRDCPSTGPA